MRKIQTKTTYLNNRLKPEMSPTMISASENSLFAHGIKDIYRVHFETLKKYSIFLFGLIELQIYNLTSHIQRIKVPNK